MVALAFAVWAYAHTFQSYGSEEKESTTPAFMGPLAAQHGDSRVVASPDGGGSSLNPPDGGASQL